MADIFVSYASEDREKVRSLVESLEMQNWTVWWDRQISPGEGFADEIDRQIQDAACVVVIWSKSSVESRWVKSEALEAMERDILVPIKLENVRIPVAFKQIQTVDLLGWPDPESKADYPALMAAIAHLVGVNSKPEGAIEEPNSIFVRPFVNMSRDPEHEFLADGITEDLITNLSHMDDMFVVASSTSFNLRDKTADSASIGTDLGVRYVLEGSVRPMGLKIRVTARLIESVSGNPIFSDHFDQAADEFYLLQDELVDAIVSKMGWQLLATEREKVRKLPVEELDARNLLIKVTTLEGTLTARGRDEALALLDRALAKAPDYPPALARKALFLGGGTSNMLSSNIEEDRQQIRTLSHRALTLAPGSARIHTMTGAAHGLAGLYDEAIDLLERAQHLAPGLIPG